MLGVLRLEIQSQYQTQGDFARACRKSEAWLSRIIRGRKEPSQVDKELISSILKPEYPEVLFINTDLSKEEKQTDTYSGNSRVGLQEGQAPES